MPGRACTIAARQPIVSSSLSAGKETFQQGLCEVMCLLQAGFQRVLMVDFDGAIPEFYHPHLAPAMPTWPYAVALVIEAGSNLRCETQPQMANPQEAALPQSLQFLQHYLQDTSDFTVAGERLAWRWQRS